jgi:predicted porin
VHWHPDEHWQAGARVILSNDTETRTQGGATTSGLLRAYEYRLGVAYSPWRGTLFDVGGDGLDRASALDGTSSFKLYPTVGAEQALVLRRVWVRAGLDETTWTTGMSVAFKPMKIDLAYLYNIAAARTGNVFGTRNTSLIATINIDYEVMMGLR